MQGLKSSSSGGRGFLIAFGAIFALAGLFVMGGALQDGEWFVALFALPFLAGGLGIIVIPLLAGMKLGPAEARIDPPSLRLGEAFTFTYRQPVKKTVDVTRVRITFLFRESATYTRGTDTYTDRHDRPIEQFEQPGRRFQPGESIAEELALKIPEDGMHSFSASNNKLQWLIHLRIELAGWPDVNEEYEVQVLPERIG